MKIAVLVPVCSRNQDWKTLDECFWIRHSLPSLKQSLSPGFEYTLYIGIDDDDAFFLSHRDELGGKPVLLHGCQHAPAWAWNQLFKVAVEEGNEYFFQMADDVILETTGWTEACIHALRRTNNRGVVGPCHLENYRGRMAAGQQPVLENAFVHRTHYDLFKTFYPAEIRNWYCDDWITQVYAPSFSTLLHEHTVRNLSIHAPRQRYAVENASISSLVQQGRTQILRHVRGCFSFCLYGSYSDKYYKGLLENMDLIRKHYPSWTIVVYASPQAYEFVSSHCQEALYEVYNTQRDDAVNMLYRFLPTTDPKFDVVCVRDADSRIHERDRWCIDHFLASPYRAYTIRDHAWHRYPIMGGLWGCKQSANVSRSLLDQALATASPRYCVDTDFLRDAVYPRLVSNMIVYCYRPDGLLGLDEKIQVIEHPIVNKEFCGNVLLYNPEPYYEFEPNCT